jgi:hypothetical protein
LIPALVRPKVKSPPVAASSKEEIAVVDLLAVGPSGAERGEPPDRERDVA